MSYSNVIIPNEGLGNLRFGVSSSDVHALLGNNFTSFRRGFGKTITDQYFELNLLLSYDENDKLEFIEVPKEGDVVFEGIHFFNGTLQQILDKMARLGFHAMYDNEVYSFDDVGIGLWVPHKSIEAVSIYRRGYYD